jgi:hypothetical protein
MEKSIPRLIQVVGRIPYGLKLILRFSKLLLIPCLWYSSKPAILAKVLTDSIFLAISP